MKRYLFSFVTGMILLAPVSCSEDSASMVDLRGRLTYGPEDVFLTVCDTGEILWVDLYALQPWWPQMGATGDAGLAPPMYLNMRAAVESKGPYGHGAKLDRAVVSVEAMRTITPTIPTDCSM
jgi:hypothetical protein